MNKPFRIVEHRPGNLSADPEAVLYTIHYDGEAFCETDNFFNSDAVNAQPDSDSLRVRYDELYRTHGLYEPLIGLFGEGWFRDEGEGCLALEGKLTPQARRLLPKPPPRLRLYAFCIDRLVLRDSPGILDALYEDEPGFPIAVFGGGGIKTKKNPLDCDNVRHHFQTIHSVRRCLVERIQQGSVWISADGFSLRGDLHFETQS